jgi:hypothetical protein
MTPLDHMGMFLESRTTPSPEPVTVSVKRGFFNNFFPYLSKFDNK